MKGMLRIEGTRTEKESREPDARTSEPDPSHGEGAIERQEQAVLSQPIRLHTCMMEIQCAYPAVTVINTFACSLRYADYCTTAHESNGTQNAKGILHIQQSLTNCLVAPPCEPPACPPVLRSTAPDFAVYIFGLRLWFILLCRSPLSHSLLRRRKLHVRTQPRQALEDALARRRATGLDLPDMVLRDPVKLELIRDLLRSQSCAHVSLAPIRSQPALTPGSVLTRIHILLIRKHKQQRILHLAILYYSLQLPHRLVHARLIITVHHEDQALRAAEVVPPQRPDLVLPADIPDVEFGVLVGHGLDVEADGGDGGYVAFELELVEDGWGGVSVVDVVGRGYWRILVLPAASSPSINNRISLDPKILFIIFEMEPPMAPVVYGSPADAIFSSIVRVRRAILCLLTTPVDAQCACVPLICSIPGGVETWTSSDSQRAFPCSLYRRSRLLFQTLRYMYPSGVRKPFLQFRLVHSCNARQLVSQNYHTRIP